jgi:hypothetical protein
MSQPNKNLLLLHDRDEHTIIWWNTVHNNFEKLRNLIRDYHPKIGLGRNISMPVTAQNAEHACEVVRNRIRKEPFFDPVEQFNQAVAVENAVTVYDLLSDTWFGVPESTSCWRIEGFPEMVDLLDSLPPE